MRKARRIFTKGEKEDVDEDFLCINGDFIAKVGNKKICYTITTVIACEQSLFCSKIRGEKRKKLSEHDIRVAYTSGEVYDGNAI